MVAQNKKAKTISKTIINNRIRKDSKKAKRRRVNSKLLVLVMLFTTALVIAASYAWFSVSLNVKVKFLDLVVSSDSGLFISLDGINYSDSIEITMNSVIRDLKETYPAHTNQWAAGGLWPVSTVGIRNSNMSKFDIYVGEIGRYKAKQGVRGKRYLSTTLSREDRANAANVYIAFDIFLKNVSGSPFPDNLYLEDIYVEYPEDTPEDVIEDMSGIVNSIRFGFIKIASVPTKTDPSIVQNLQCNNRCEQIIYEPNSLLHSERSIIAAQEHGITLIDGTYTPTYAIIKEGEFLKHINGHEGTGIELDTEHFKLQETIDDIDLERPVYSIPNGVTKFRVYIWVEGQDVDSLETNSRGTAIYISIGFVKDLAGYEIE